MSVGPPLAGSSLSFALLVLKEVVIYFKRKSKRVKDLFKDFLDLKLEVDDLLERWQDINDEIELHSTSMEKNRQHTTMKRKVSWIQTNFVKMEQLYRDLWEDLDPKVRAALGLNAVTEEQRPQDLEDQNQPLRNAAANEKERSQEAENENETNKSGAANENQANIAEQKIWTRNFFKFAELDVEVVKLKPKVSAVKKELVLGDLTRQAKPKIVRRMKAESVGFLTSHQEHLDNLLQYVKKQNHQKIGIIGAARVGKTNILKSLNNCFDSSSPTYCGWSVGYVIWVPVPEENNKEKLIQTIQEEIIDRLQLPKGSTRRQNEDIISSFLSRNKYLLLLDDFSQLVELEDIGIKKEHEQGKVVMAARNANALGNVLLEETIVVQSLSPREAHDLFKSFIVNHEKLTEEQKDMVYTIVRPLVLPEPIKIVARKLNDHPDPTYWKGVKDRLQSGNWIKKLSGLAELAEIYERAYEDLEEYLKKCLLYVALFPSGHYISRNYLAECWKAEDFLDCRSPTLNAARAEGMVISTELEDSCLLELCSENCVKMSPFFRKVAFFLPFPGEGGQGSLCVRSGSDIDGGLEERDWNNARRVSLIRNNLESESLPKSPKCKDISTLFLQVNPNLKLVQDDFFVIMKSLRVLDLHGTGITSLPTSITCLIALRSLYLNDCGDLNRLPTTINQLKELEVLDVRSTSIPCLPAAILNIVSLRCLRISFAIENCNNLATGSKLWKPLDIFFPKPNQSWVIFPPDAHTKLSNLEEMTIDLRGEVSNRVRENIKEEAFPFTIRKGFKFELSPSAAQSLGPESQASKNQTEELSNVNVVEEPARAPTNVDEKPADSSPSTAVVLQSNHNEISDGQNTTSQSDSHRQIASRSWNCFGTPPGMFSRVDKGKGVAKPPVQRKKPSKRPQIQNHHQQGIKIIENSETNNTAARYDTDNDDESEESVDDQLRRASKNVGARLDISAGEGTSASH